MTKKFIKFVNGMVWKLTGTESKTTFSDTGIMWTECDKKYMYIWGGSSGTYDVYHAIEVKEGE